MKNAALLTLLFWPALLLIDFGHFQYNSVMLGPFLLGKALLRAHIDHNCRLHTTRCNEFYFRKRSPGGLLLYSWLGI